jgi:hypothetical protein
MQIEDLLTHERRLTDAQRYLCKEGFGLFFPDFLLEAAGLINNFVRRRLTDVVVSAKLCFVLQITSLQ